MNYTISSNGIEVDIACGPWYNVLASCVGSLQCHQSVHWLLICNDKAQRIFAVQTGLLVMLNDLPSYRGRYSLPTRCKIYGKYSKNYMIVSLSNGAMLYILLHLEPIETLLWISSSTHLHLCWCLNTGYVLTETSTTLSWWQGPTLHRREVFHVLICWASLLLPPIYQRLQ